MSQLDCTTPKGHRAIFDVRDGTADHNNVWSCSSEDEYALRSVDLGSGTAVDVGAHIGGVSVSLALDNPEARIVAVECLSENVRQLQANVDRNGVSDRVTVLHRAAAEPGRETSDVQWNFSGDISGEHHRYIANAVLPPSDKRVAQHETVECIDLAALVAMSGGYIDFMKVDAEGAEYPLFSSPACKDVGSIVGEYHAGWQPLYELLNPTHVLTQLSGTDNFGGFRATRRDVQ